MADQGVDEFTQAVQIVLAVVAVSYGFGFVVSLFSAPPGRLDKSARNERRRLRATYLNTIAAGLAVTGVVGPVATYLYGTTAETHREPWQLGLEILLLVASSVVAHGLALRTLGGLEP